MAQKSIGAFTAAGGIPPVRQQFDKEFLKQMSPSILLTVDLSNSFLFDLAGFTTSNPLCSKRSGTRSWASKALSPMRRLDLIYQCRQYALAPYKSWPWPGLRWKPVGLPSASHVAGVNHPKVSKAFGQVVPGNTDMITATLLQRGDCSW